VLNIHTARLLHTLSLARKEENYFDFLKSLSRIELLVLDDWMRDSVYLPAAQDLLEVFDDRFNLYNGYSLAWALYMRA